MRNKVYAVFEGRPIGQRKTFAICAMETQEPIAGFDNLVMDQGRAIEYARTLSNLETFAELAKLADEAEAESTNNSECTFDFEPLDAGNSIDPILANGIV